MSNADAAKRNEEQSLLLEVMLLALAADGVIEAAEITELARTVGELPEFAGYAQSNVEALLSEAFRMLDQQGVDQRLAALSASLGDKRSRLLAYALAHRVCLADGKVPASEVSFLGKLRGAFGLRHVDVEKVHRNRDARRDLRAVVEGIVGA